MKILCLQLARFGDIFQTWPVLHGLKRVVPNAEIHFLVRERFQAAAEGCDAVDEVKLLPNREIFSSLFQDSPNIHGALGSLGRFIASLREENYDRIINLSFSPSSSYLVDAVTRAHTEVVGYTRHRDGFLAIPDDASSYFYAQVGTEHSNRIHLTDLFALVAGLELTPEDFRGPSAAVAPSGFDVSRLNSKRVIVHVGASQADKVCDAATWKTLLNQLATSYDGQIVLVGGPEDRERVPAEELNSKILNLIGATSVPELFWVVTGAECVLGCDSMVVHIAALVNAPTLNISFAAVKFWETGPRARGSRVIWFETPSAVQADVVARQTLALVRGETGQQPYIQKAEAFGLIYDLHGYHDDTFAWELTKALYMNHPFPMTTANNIRLGFLRLAELAHLGLEQISYIKDKEKQGLAVSILDEVDGMVVQIARLVPEIAPVTRWFQCEKLRIGPAGVDEVISATRSVFERLFEICQIYKINQSFNESLKREDLTWKP